ncbi:MAG TPA: FkbM family methyltransferase [Thermoanaerobaculia bacterium]|nr:FkbM family methyltransferase [Thermoanaerobaculia bacterium]
MIRALLERLSRDRILRRRLPASFGGAEILVSPASALKLWRRDLRRVDPWLFAAVSARVKPGSTVWDVGANVGLFAFGAAFRAGTGGRVVALEADPWLAELVWRSAGDLPADYAPVTALGAAVAAQVGIGELALARRGRAASHLTLATGSSQTGGTRSLRPVVTLTLDWLLERLAPPQLVKIDVEGAEVACLEGGARLLGEARPELLIEVTEANVPRATALLEGHGYRLFDAADPASPKATRAAVWNTLALPAERC